MPVTTGPQSHLRGIERTGWRRGARARRAASIAPQRHRKVVVALGVVLREERLNRTSEASKVGFERAVADDEGRASIAPQRHRKEAVALNKTAIAGLNRTSEASKGDRRRLARAPPPGLNRTSEASKVLNTVVRASIVASPQSHLRGIESSWARVRPASPPWPQSHLRGIES